MLFGLNHFPTFFLKWCLCQSIRLLGLFSLLAASLVLDEDIDFSQLTKKEYIVFAVIGVLYILAQLVPMLMALLIDQLKGDLQV